MLSKSSKNKIKWIINVAVLLVVTGLSIFYISKKGVVTIESLKQVKWYAFLIVFGFFILGYLLLSLIDWFIYKSMTNKMTYPKCFVNTMSGQLGSSATPYKIGHFPLMLYYQHHQGVELSHTLTCVIKCQVIYSITSIFLYTIVVITLGALGLTINFNGTVVALWLVVSLGLIFHVAVFVGIILLSFIKPLQEKFLCICGKVLVKLKKANTWQEYADKKRVKFQIYREQIADVFLHIHKNLHTMGLYLVYMLLSGSLQYISYLLISGASFDFGTALTFYVLNLASAYITNIVPIPGGAGTAEILFSMVFTTVIADAFIGSTLILWRTSTFYMAIVFELIVFVSATIIRNVQIARKKSKEIDVLDNSNENANESVVSSVSEEEKEDE